MRKTLHKHYASQAAEASRESSREMCDSATPAGVMLTGAALQAEGSISRIRLPT
ncbi:MAG: hypothetical protein WAN03_10380 [Candidatus Sulfotelmatobacter sp.]